MIGFSARDRKLWLIKAHSPDPAPSDYHILGHLKRHLGGKRFGDKDNLAAGVKRWFTTLDGDFPHTAYIPFHHVGKTASIVKGIVLISS